MATILDAGRPDAIEAAADILRRGGLVAMPTETVYGLAGDARNANAVARIFEAKGRPTFNPLIAHLEGVDAAAREARLNATARRLAAAFWPGPLTLVAPIAESGTVCDLARAGLETIALRAPAHPAAQALLAAFGAPIAAPSANRSGRLSPTTAEHVAADLGDAVDLILDGGPCGVGLESTVVSVVSDPPALLRLGGLAAETIEAVAGALARGGDDPAAPSSPGQLLRHYAPRAALRLYARAPEPNEAYLSFGPGGPAPNLSPTGDLTDAAANLFAMLRALDATAERIAVAPIPNHGLGEAINDRLTRAAER